jgi:hypothetical protein
MQGYNPRTGRYGYAESSWNGKDWYNHAETYNPRTGVSTEADRHYNAKYNSLHTERTRTNGQGSASMERNIYGGASEVQRETSRGGSSQMNRSISNGTISSDGSVTTGGGRSATIEGERTIGQGGSSTITGSEGGQMKSVTAPGGGRTTVGQSGSGDLYAGHNGNVYKKTDDGWSHYGDGGWQPVDKTTRPDSTGSAASRNAGQYGSSRDMSQLNRDYSARQRGNQQFQQRRNYGGGFNRGGGGRRR